MEIDQLRDGLADEHRLALLASFEVARVALKDVSDRAKVLRQDLRLTTEEWCRHVAEPDGIGEGYQQAVAFLRQRVAEMIERDRVVLASDDGVAYLVCTA